MSFTELLENLETLTPEQREIVLERLDALEETQFILTPEQEKLVEERLAEHHRDPSSAIPLEKLIKRLNENNA